MNGQAFGVIGLEVMGRNIALNIERNGFPVAVYNRTWAKTEAFLNDEGKGKRFKAGNTIADFVQLLERPRRILMMVKAGAPVDAVVKELRPHLEQGDILIDGGNSLFTDTERRMDELAGSGIKFFGMGVSGGEEGALWGPSLMPGGERDAYEHLRPIFEKIAAKTEDDGPCVTYIGNRGSGHFVKTIHNGIEYGDMQLIAEAYDLLKHVGGLSHQQLQQVFEEWNEAELKSFLIEITAKVINFPDSRQTGKALVENIRDVAGMKGTGTWTIISALNLLIPVPTIAAAVDAREISAMKDQREKAARLLPGPSPRHIGADSKRFINDVRAALYCSKICSYAQGMTLLAAANHEFNYGMRLDEIARIWKAGCIIRAIFLDDIKKALKEEPHLPNLLLAARFREAMQPRQDAWRRIVSVAALNGVPTPAFSASLAYYDSYRRARLPASLIQAQRDFFGAHTYEREEAPGQFIHTEWSQQQPGHEPPDDATGTEQSARIKGD